MLNHLDDPKPHTFPSDFRGLVRSRGRSIRARRRATVLATAVITTVVLGAAGLYARALTRIDDVDRITVAGTGVPVGAGRTILLAGTDRDLGGPVVRTDTLMVVRLEAGRASVLSIPRDLAVPAPGGTEQVRVNTIAADHGYDRLLRILDESLGIDVDNVIEIDFQGFATLVDLVGGIDVHTTAPLRDQLSGLTIEADGCHRLDGASALALARSRYLQHLSDGRWRTDPTGDLGRMSRQPILLTAGLQALTRTRPDPLTTDRLAGWLVDHASVDDTLDTPQLIGLLRSAIELEPEDVSFGILPVEAITLDNGAAVLHTTNQTASAVDRWQAGKLTADVVNQDVVTNCPT